MNTSLLRGRYARIVLVLLFLAVLLGLVQACGLRQSFNVAFLRQTLSENRVEGLALFVLLFSLGNLVHIPGWIFLASAVLVLGKVDGALVTYAAASVSCAVTFLSVRLVGGNAVGQLRGKLARRLLSQLHAHPIRNVMLLRIVFQTLASLNYALALSGLEFKKYMAGTLLGLPLPIAVYCLLFDAIVKLVS